VEQICIRGCPRSGTHLAEWFVNQHAKGSEKFVVSSHRHRVWLESDPERMFLVTKDPVSWVISMHRFVSKLATNRSMGRLFDVHVDGQKWKDAETPDEFWEVNRIHLIRYRNGLMRQWLDCGANVFWCPYEAMIARPDLVLRLLDLWWKDRFEQFVFLFPAMPLADGGTKRKKFGLDYYLDEHWRQEMILKNQLEIRYSIPM